LGTWQLGGSEWGDVAESDALATLSAAADAGVTFFDTADIYGQGRSESLIGQFLKGREDRDRFFIATKLGRSSDPGWPQNFEPATIRLHTERSLQRLGVDALDLTQTHCIPAEVMREGEVWDALRQLKQEGKIRAFGASVESMEEARDCLKVDGLSSLQIIFNIFRQKPISELFAEARKQNVALIIRLPLASGLLSGRMSASSQFATTDHRNFNRDGAAFNVGETFAGLPFSRGLELVETLRPWVPADWTMSEWALRWCLDFPEVTTVIPGATRPQQATGNARASQLEPLSKAVHEKISELYREQIASWIRGKY
jgi:aryl-alcohol dehydrogenase-like predicted oxidoreductase